MSLWYTILGRETLDHLPCVPEGIDVGMNAISYFCSAEEAPECKIADLCPLHPIYEEYMAMRAVVKAVLYDRTPAHMARAARRSPAAFPDRPEVVKRYGAIAEAWEAIA